jgi:hypothetical protein
VITLFDSDFLLHKSLERIFERRNFGSVWGIDVDICADVCVNDDKSVLYTEMNQR